MVQSRQAYLARQDARLARYTGYQGSHLLYRRCLLRRRQDVERPAQARQPSGDPGQSQCGGLRSRPAQERSKDKGTAQDLWQEDKAEVVTCECRINAAGCQSGLRRASSPVYGEHNVTLRYRVCDLLWRPAGRLVRFVVVVHPTRGSCILMCTDTSLSAADIIRLYGLRFKIECSFKQAVRQIGSFSYHFWMKDMIPLRYHNGNQYLHRKSADYRNRVKRKMRAYHAFIQAGVVAQGLLQYLAIAAPKLVWSSFGSWLRTIRPDIPPSEFVVAKALRQTLPEFLMGPAKSDSLTKFIAERQDMQNMPIFRLAS